MPLFPAISRRQANSVYQEVPLRADLIEKRLKNAGALIIVLLPLQIFLGTLRLVLFFLGSTEPKPR